jgi:hypothetical protein
MESALGVLQAPSIKLTASAEITGIENFMPVQIPRVE